MVSWIMDKLECVEHFPLIVLTLIGFVSINIAYNSMAAQHDEENINISHFIGFFGGLMTFFAIAMVIVATHEQLGGFQEPKYRGIQYLSMLIIFLIYALAVIISKIAVAIKENKNEY